MPAAKLLIEFYFLRQEASPLPMTTEQPNEDREGLFFLKSAHVCVDTRTDCGLVERAGARSPQTVPPPHTHTSQKEEVAAHTADFSRSSHPSRLFHAFTG